MDYDKYIQGGAGKNILVIGCLHGDELIGREVIKKLRKLNVSRGVLTTVIANTRAIKAGKRFIDQDLNRSFPGNSKGNHEERLAHSLMPLIKKADVVIDIHSTTTDTESTIILTKINQSIRRVIFMFNPRRVVIMKKGVSKIALTGYCRAGISFEYGKDKSAKARKDTLADIITILENYGMIAKKKGLIKTNKTEYFKIFGALARCDGFRLEKNIKNFLHISRGDIVARCGQNTQKASQDFYPVLFGEKAYKEIWGFMAIKIKSSN